MTASFKPASVAIGDLTAHPANVRSNSPETYEGSLHKSDIIVRFARTNQEPTRHREDHFSEVA